MYARRYNHALPCKNEWVHRVPSEKNKAPYNRASQQAPVTQWIEYSPPKGKVAGSIPAWGTTMYFSKSLNNLLAPFISILSGQFESLKLPVSSSALFP